MTHEHEHTEKGEPPGDWEASLRQWSTDKAETSLRDIEKATVEFEEELKAQDGTAQSPIQSETLRPAPVNGSLSRLVIDMLSGRS